MNRDELRQRAAVVRDVALETVLIRLRCRTRSPGQVQMAHRRGHRVHNRRQVYELGAAEGGGGAIDLVMHLTRVDYCTAVAWLEHHLGIGHLGGGWPMACSFHKSRPALDDETLRLPVRDNRMLGRVINYLTRCRHLGSSLLEPLMELGKLYADGRGNAVFLLVTEKPNRPVGAELRGTGTRVWRGMAPGTRKDLGYFWIGAGGLKNIVLCESAIDAISCFQLHPDRICISTSGVRANPRWLSTLMSHGYTIHCGFDTDDAGETAASRMMELYPAIQRMRPPAHDWNEVLAPGK